MENGEKEKLDNGLPAMEFKMLCLHFAKQVREFYKNHENLKDYEEWIKTYKYADKT
ncbi:MAG: hypothetical protein LUD27_01950 [Clostridia bacterium]|nr:hypothetical protein [Clostridia bacterium]